MIPFYFFTDKNIYKFDLRYRLHSIQHYRKYNVNHVSERHTIRYSVETLRKWMTAEGLGVRIRGVNPGSINHVTDAIALVSLFRLMALTTTG